MSLLPTLPAPLLLALLLLAALVLAHLLLSPLPLAHLLLAYILLASFIASCGLLIAGCCPSCGIPGSCGIPLCTYYAVSSAPFSFIRRLLRDYALIVLLHSAPTILAAATKPVNASEQVLSTAEFEAAWKSAQAGQQ